MTFWACHRQQCRSSAGGDGILASARNGVRDRLALAPLPSRPASDPTLITLVKGTYSGEIESQSRPRNRVSRPRNAISRELTSLVNVLVRLSTVSTTARCHINAMLMTSQYRHCLQILTGRSKRNFLHNAHFGFLIFSKLRILHHFVCYLSNHPRIS